MDKFTKEELDKIESLLEPKDRTNHHLAYSLLRGRMKLSEVKRFVIEKWAREEFKKSRYSKISSINTLHSSHFVNDVLKGRKWETVWYAEPLIATLAYFEVFGIKYFLLNGKYKDL